MTLSDRIRCAVCSAFKNLCQCGDDAPHQTTTDAAPRCPDKVEAPEPAGQAPEGETIRQKFERFCDDHPDHHDCRIYD